MSCPDGNAVAQYVEGLLGAAEAESLERHAASCARCHWLLGAAALTDEEQGTRPTKVDGGDPAVPSNADLAVGAELQQRYVIESFIGEGGMGRVYAVTHKRLARRFAIKVLNVHRSNHEAGIARIQREAEITSRLAHPNLIEIIDFDFTESGLPYIVMELLEGESLDQRLRRGPITDLKQLLDLLRQICSGLEAAHRHGVVHRDLKPSNIHLGSSPTGPLVKVLDFGISKVLSEQSSLTETIAVLGTPRYMAPEQARGESAGVDQRADIFSLGAILFEALTGQPAFQGRSLFETMRKVVLAKPDTSPAWRAVAAPIRRVVMKCLAKAPQRRPSSMARLYQQLVRAFTAAGVTPPPSGGSDSLLLPISDPFPSEAARWGTRLGRRPWLWGLALLLPAAAITIALTQWRAGPAAPATDRPAVAAVAAGRPGPSAAVAVTRAADAQALADAHGSASDGTPASSPVPPKRTQRPKRARSQPRGHGTLAVQSHFKGTRLWADVYLDGAKVGQTGLTLPRVPAGWHRLEVRRAGYAHSSRRVFVAPDKTTAIRFELTRATRNGAQAQ